MIDLFQLWEEFCGEYNTHQNGHVRPNRTFVNWVNVISGEIFEDKFKNGWQKSQKVTDDIGLPFLKSMPIQVIPGASNYDIIPYPPDYGHYSSCRYFHHGDAKAVAIDCTNCQDKDSENFYYENNDETLQEVSFQLVRNNQWDSVIKHFRKKPTLSNPKLTQFNGGFKIAPKGIGTVVLDYLVKPKPATFAYTLGPEDQIIYDENNSKPLEWSSLMKPEFLVRLGMKYGKFTKQADIYQASDKEKSTM